MATGVQQSWSTTAASNATADTAINWREGQAASTVNNSAREMMAAVKRLALDLSGSIVTGGTKTAYTVTTNEGFAALANGLTFRARMNVASGSAPTINVDGLGAKAINVAIGKAPSIGKLLKDAVYQFTYKSTDDVWPVSGVGERNVGDIVWSGADAAPALCVLAYGQAISRTDYPALYEVYGTTYGVGDGSTTFNVPDVRGRVIAGQDDMGGVSADRLTNQSGGVEGDTLGAVGGSETHALTSGQNGTHSHSVSGNTGGTSSTFTYSANSANWGGGSNLTITNVAATGLGSTITSPSHTHSISLTSAESGSGTAHNNVQPTIILNAYVYAGA